MLWVNQPRRLAAHPKNGGSDKTDVDREIEKCVMSSSGSYVVFSQTKEGHLFEVWKLETKSMKVR